MDQEHLLIQATCRPRDSMVLVLKAAPTVVSSHF